jgi:hypothetical protein
LHLDRREILRFAQNDSKPVVSAAREAATRKFFHGDDFWPAKRAAVARASLARYPQNIEQTLDRRAGIVSPVQETKISRTP